MSKHNCLENSFVTPSLAPPRGEGWGGGFSWFEGDEPVMKDCSEIFGILSLDLICHLKFVI
jgi:hypothetical protein